MISLQNSYRLDKYLHNIYLLFRESPSVVEPLLNNYIVNILTELLISQEAKTTNMVSAGIISDSIAYINEHLTEALSLDDLAGQASLSPYYFSRFFKKETGFSHHSYVITTRISNAKFLLHSSDLSVKSICFATGFNGQEIPLALSFADIRPYETTVCYAGATLGPNAGRLRGARLPILGKEYVLSENENGSQLHGGRHNLSSILWNVDSVTDHVDSVTGAKMASSILLSAAQPDGLDGYLGNRRYQVRYTLADPGILTMEYTAWTDVPTYINLSNHTYWNLSGDFTKPALTSKSPAGQAPIRQGLPPQASPRTKSFPPPAFLRIRPAGGRLRFSRTPPESSSTPAVTCLPVSRSPADSARFPPAPSPWKPRSCPTPPAFSRTLTASPCRKSPFTG